MATYLLTWNPQKWDWGTLDDDLHTYRTKGLWGTSWSCGNRKSIFPDDRVFLIKQGRQNPRGIFASGYVMRGPITGRHFTDEGKQATYINVDFDVLLDPREDVLPRDWLDKSPFNSVHWGTQSGGILIPPNVADSLEDLWEKHVSGLGLNPVARQFSTDKEVTIFVEGARRKVLVSRLERSASARTACINSKGVRCLCCQIDFSERYGTLGKGFIHVHHQELLAEGGPRETNPIDDLFPVCPNCHAMLHRSNPPMTIKELRRRLR